MIRSIHAELLKLTRPRVVAVWLLVTTVFVAGLTAVGILTAAESPSGGPSSEPFGGLSVPGLADAGGGTAVFVQTAGFGTVFLLAVFVATIAGELTRGTFRTMLLQQPARGRVLAGKVAALVGFTAALTLHAEAVAWVTARLLAPVKGIDAAAWSTIDGLAAAGSDYGRMVVFVIGWAILGTLIGVLARSVPIGVGIGLVWFGPVENVIADGWTPAQEYFPGLVLRAIVSPDTAVISTSRALATMTAYAAVALGVTAIALRRRDVTA
ncbi:MAG: ABC transporter permease [Ilumatobacteraceae bacterium]